MSNINYTEEEQKRIKKLFNMIDRAMGMGERGLAEYYKDILINDMRNKHSCCVDIAKIKLPSFPEINDHEGDS